MNNKLEISEINRRALTIPNTFNEENRTVQIVFSTGSRVMRGGYFTEPFIEELSLEPGDVRLDRFEKGASLLNNHSSYEIRDVLGVTSSPSVDGERGIVDVKFSKREDVEPVFQDVKDGILKNFSVGYRVYKYQEVGEENGVKVLRAIDWEPMEVSLVGIPADPNAQVRNNSEKNQCEIVFKENTKMKKENTETVIEPKVDEVAIRKEATETAKKNELERVSGIMEVLRKVNLEDKAMDLIKTGKSVDEVRAFAIDELAKRDATQQTISANKVEIVTDEQDTLKDSVRSAMMNRIDPSVELEKNGKDFVGLSLLETARNFVPNNKGMSRVEVAERALSTSDFPEILANVAGKKLSEGYKLLGKTFEPLLSENTTLPDFKESKIVSMGSAPSLEKVVEGGEYQVGEFGEGAEKYSVLKYGKMIMINEETIINDDLNALSRIPRKLGIASSRLESNLFYAILTGNPVMADGTAIFHADHGNLGSSAAVGETGLTAGRKAMRAQKDGEDYLDIFPKYIVSGPNNEDAIKRYLHSAMLANTQANIRTMTDLKPVIDPRIANGNWFLFADPRMIDTIIRAYLEGMKGPQLTQKQGFNVDGVALKIRHIVGFKAIESKSMYKNPQA